MIPVPPAHSVLWHCPTPAPCGHPYCPVPAPCDCFFDMCGTISPCGNPTHAPGLSPLPCMWSPPVCLLCHQWWWHPPPAIPLPPCDHLTCYALMRSSCSMFGEIYWMGLFWLISVKPIRNLQLDCFHILCAQHTQCLSRVFCADPVTSFPFHCLIWVSWACDQFESWHS